MRARKTHKIRKALALVVWVCVWGRGADAAPIIAAYQEIYRMNFEAIHQDGIPAGWYATFDGYLVAQVRPNHWVYGRADHQSVLVPTEVAVGAAVPMNVPYLARVALPSWRSGAYDTERFRVITRSLDDNMGVLDDPLAYTPVAWKSGEPRLLVWLGNKWYKVIPKVGQSVSQTLMERHPYIVRTLRKKDAAWSMSDTQELADLAREWGFLWHGHVPFVSFAPLRNNNGSERGADAFWSREADDGGRQWDIEDDGKTGGGGSNKPGGWD